MDLCSTAAEAAGEDGNVAKLPSRKTPGVVRARALAGVGRVLEGLTLRRACSYSLAGTRAKARAAAGKRQPNPQPAVSASASLNASASAT